MHDRLEVSIRSTLLLTALFAALLAVFLCNPSAASVLARFIVGFLLMSLAIIAIDITAGAARAFWIGVAAPLAMASIWLSVVGNQVPLLHRGWAAQMDSFWQSFANALSGIPISCCVALVNGLLCALVYRLLRPHLAPVSIPHLTFSLYGFCWLAVVLVAIAFFLAGMTFDRWRAALESSGGELAHSSVFGLNDRKEKAGESREKAGESRHPSFDRPWG